MRIVDDESSFGVSMMFSLNGTDRFNDYIDTYYFEGFTLVLITEFILVVTPKLVFLLKPLRCIQKGISIIIQIVQVAMIA